ncbi:hypothetical protein ILUMI_05143 [Ignelater luminosus]|uniref:Uncharacterized protein n=1 Tax=Ignelater luminosus TaxID=2038154 RepID=A0A8K0D7U5_IGNLU|nr:hypothetical protein ILUMI_05143 [Ignelater luminosus]
MEKAKIENKKDEVFSKKGKEIAKRTKKKTEYKNTECTEKREATHKGNWATGYSAMSKLDQQLDEESIFGRKSKLPTSPARARAFTYSESEDEEKDEKTERKALERRKKWFIDNVCGELLLYNRRRVSPPRPRANSVTKIDVSKVKEPDTSSQTEDKTALRNVGTINQDRERRRGRQKTPKHEKEENLCAEAKKLKTILNKMTQNIQNLQKIVDEQYNIKKEIKT